MGDIERRVEEERVRVEARYREVLRSAVAFEKKIRNRWRRKNREKNARISELEACVAQLEEEVKALRTNYEEDEMADHGTKERKLVALMVNDMGIADVEETEMVEMEEEVRELPDEELDQTLASRLDLPYPVDAEVLDRALARVEEPERISQGGMGGFTGAPDMSHEPRPEEREG
ncbi:MAG: hypothetical protein LC751_21375 [Actinobacteria bacterium]|nr:hypothetical protein [Actinomycetota bacterium]